MFRATKELGMRSVAIYSPADRLAQHRYRADESFCVGEKNTPVGAYLDYEARGLGKGKGSARAGDGPRASGCDPAGGRAAPAHFAEAFPPF